jgi:hypothetical protein
MSLTCILGSSGGSGMYECSKHENGYRVTVDGKFFHINKGNIGKRTLSVYKDYRTATQELVDLIEPSMNGGGKSKKRRNKKGSRRNRKSNRRRKSSSSRK